MIEFIRRAFMVDASIDAAWRHLAEIDHWPSWAKHIKQVELTPKGELTLNSQGVFLLKNGIKTQFRMTEINPKRNWKWVGRFLWLTIHYDHQFEKQGETKTKLTWTVEAEGIGASVVGRIFAKIYDGNLNEAIPNLIGEFKMQKAA